MNKKVTTKLLLKKDYQTLILYPGHSRQLVSDFSGENSQSMFKERFKDIYYLNKPPIIFRYTKSKYKKANLPLRHFS